MPEQLKLAKYSIGVGDRFGQQAAAQLRACRLAADAGIEVIPVWNKSHREHAIIGSDPAGTRKAADVAVHALNWPGPYHVDADHIRMETVNCFLPHADFYTIDVADWIGKPTEAESLRGFVDRHGELAADLFIPEIKPPLRVAHSTIQQIAAHYLRSVQEAGRIYRHIAGVKGEGAFITEISMDETERPQSPLELLVILCALVDEGIPAQTIAPKFTGRFNKGVDYVGDLLQFEKEFSDDLAVIAFAVRQYGLPANLKLSIHSGSDKFSLYAPIRRALTRFNAGIHLKTAGTTWLEELIGLAEAGFRGLALAREIYREALDHIDELCRPYASVIDIDRARLPSSAVVNGWTSEQYAAALRHDENNEAYNPHLRQLLHVGYKIAAQKGNEYLHAVNTYRALVSRNVTSNLFNRHVEPLFLGRNGAEPQT
jgi:tagaturonate epimerase